MTFAGERSVPFGLRRLPSRKFPEGALFEGLVSARSAAKVGMKKLRCSGTFAGRNERVDSDLHEFAH